MASPLIDLTMRNGEGTPLYRQVVRINPSLVTAIKCATTDVPPPHGPCQIYVHHNGERDLVGYGADQAAGDQVIVDIEALLWP